MGKKSRRKKASGGSPSADVTFAGLKKSFQLDQDKSIKEAKRAMEMMDSEPLPVQISTIRRVLQETGTNVAGNDADPMGDGDQSPIMTEQAREAARTLFSIGGDISGHIERNAVSRFAMLCVVGDAKGVERVLRDVATLDVGPPSQNAQLIELTETRETSMRLSSLLLTVAAGKQIPEESGQPLDHHGVVKILIRYGACPYAKDVVGKTVCHYGAGMMATRMTLDAADMCIRAAKTAHLFGKEVELFGLNNEAMNGSKGVVGGYLIENDRRAVYLYSKGKELAINPINLRPVVASDIDGSQIPMLVDVPDRMGAACLTEVILADRVDVAEFLLSKHNASIDVEDMDGCTPRGMAISGSQVCSRVCGLVQQAARDQAKNDRTEDRLHCSYCNSRADESSNLHSCAKCRSVQYCNALCQKNHWEEGHKKECKKLGGIKLDPPSDAGGAFAGMQTSLLSMKTGRSSSDGSFEKPDSVDIDERFNIKVQASADCTPMMIYDKSRQCSFMISPGQPGFDEVFNATRSQAAYQGRKSFMKASFDCKGRCTVYPGTANTKHPW